MANSKTLIFSFDGTGNEPSDSGAYAEDESVSNILKLHILLGGGWGLEDQTASKTKDGNPQITHYYNGIGTREGRIDSIPILGKFITKARQFINQTIAPSWGDAGRILEEAHQDFKDAEYQANDKLVVFGFSRGAALARKFVSQLLSQNKDCQVTFLGVFDTVAAMNGIHREGEKISSDVLFENGTLNERVERAVHILALDEDRIPFTPTLINKDNEGRILEIWFPGVHSDIGGGYWYDGLSDSALQFMIEQCQNWLINDIKFIDGANREEIESEIKAQKLNLQGIDVDDIIINPNHDGHMHTHTSVLAKVGDQEPRSVHVCVNDRPASNTLPMVHYTVKERFDAVKGYRPPALRALEFKLLLKNGDKKTVQGIAGLRELT